MRDFLCKSIKEKEADLECPVCLETAEAPIFTCQEMHLICANCRPKLSDCPECRVPYQLRRHRSVVNSHPHQMINDSLSLNGSPIKQAHN